MNSDPTMQKSGAESAPDRRAGKPSRDAVAAQLKSSRLIIVSAITLIFIQLLTDIYLAIGTAGSRSYGGAYTIGLVMLIIGAALLISAVIASRSQAPPTQP